MLNNYLNQNMGISNFSRENTALQSLEEKAKSALSKSDKKLKEAAQDFESVFINQLLQVMDKTVERSGIMKSGQAEDMFRGMFYQEISKEIAKSSSNFGMANQIYGQLSKFQGSHK